MRTLYEDLLKCMIISCCILLRMRNVLVKLLEIKEKACSMFCKFFHENLTIYVIKWKNMVQPCRPHVAILYDV